MRSGHGLARALVRLDPVFEEEQGFSGWMKAISLVGVIAVGVPAVLMWIVRPRLVPLAIIFTALTAVFLFLAAT